MVATIIITTVVIIITLLAHLKKEESLQVHYLETVQPKAWYSCVEYIWEEREATRK